MKDSVSKMVCESLVCDKVVCQRWWVTKWCVKDGLSKMVGDKVVCERWFVKGGGCHQSATPATQNEGRCLQVPRLPRKRSMVAKWPGKVTVHAKGHACHQTAAAYGVTGNQARHQSQPSAISATPATQTAGPCHQVPHLPRRMHVHVAKYHACHANSGGVHGVNWEPSAPPEPAQCHKCHACHAECTYMSPSCLICHAECTYMSPSTTSATQTAAASTCVNWEQSTPPEPAQCHKCHACHAECT